MDSLNVIHLVPSLAGGAGRAAYRIHQCLKQSDGSFDIDSRIRCLHSTMPDPAVIAGYPSQWSEFQARVKTRINSFRYRSFQGDPSIYHSIGSPGVGLPAEINASSVDLVHLHYCGDHLISIEEIPQIRKPLIWTLHDQWAFCGAEHYASRSSLNKDRFKEGYTYKNRPPNETGPDLNRKTWIRKKKAWTKPFSIIAPSHWLQLCVHQSALMHRWPVDVIPHPIDTQFWHPIPQAKARLAFNLNSNQTILLFGVDHGCAKLTKGADLLMRALEILRERCVDPASLLLAVFGQPLATQHRPRGISYCFLGRLDDQQLQYAYSAADVLVMPSRVEAFGLTAAEAQACGTPVVAYRTSGLIDVVDHGVTGALADPFDPQSLADAIEWMLKDRDRLHSLARAAREKAVNQWSESAVRTQYLAAYQRCISIGRH